MKKIHIAISWLLLLCCLWLLFSGIQIALSTTGTVYGSEFGMLITIANIGGKILILLVLQTLWRWSSSTETASLWMEHLQSIKNKIHQKTKS